MKTDEIIETHWTQLINNTSPAARMLLRDLAHRQSGELASAFYAEMQRDADAAPFLAMEETRGRLHQSMQRWISDLLTSWDADQAPGLLGAQRHMGNVHARIGVHIELIMRGARVIKRSIIHSLLDDDEVNGLHLEAARIAIELIDMALEVVANQYSKAHEAAARKDEAYRNYAASVNMSLERERQRAALFAWENELLQAVVVGNATDLLPPVSKSSVGLWLRHKAPAIFPNCSEFADIMESVERIDEHLIPFYTRRYSEKDHEESRRLLNLVLGEVKQIQYLLDTLFEHLVNLESGRDALTQLLSRRFQSTILSREIELSRASGKPFAMMLIDIDHFKSINDRFGHETGDRVLQQVANIFVSSVRSGDFVFRHGGEEFMILCVELTIGEAMKLADKIRRAVEAESFISEKGQISVTVSIGVAAHDGHPDYQRLIERADRALYDAKHRGRNNCVQG